jgi:hypothetical protein
LELAHTVVAGDRRNILLQMAQVWQRLADGLDPVLNLPEVSTPPRATEHIRPMFQQQQQVQPKDENKCKKD